MLTYLDFIAERSPGWVTYQVLAGHDPDDEASRVRREAREAAVAALAEVVGGSRGHRDDFALWGYLGFLDDACLRWVRAGCPDDQRHRLIDAALGCLEGALGDWRKRTDRPGGDFRPTTPRSTGKVAGTEVCDQRFT